jgi:hypothetical protein
VIDLPYILSSFMLCSPAPYQIHHTMLEERQGRPIDCETGSTIGFEKPERPNFSSQGPDGYTVGSNINITWIAKGLAVGGGEPDKRARFTGKILPFEADASDGGVTLFG